MTSQFDHSQSENDEFQKSVQPEELDLRLVKGTP